MKRALQQPAALFLGASLLAACGGGGSAALASTAGAGSRSASESTGQQALDKLVAQARKEGALNTNLRPGLGPVIPELSAAFNKRFGLNLQISLDALTTEGELVAKNRSAMQAGAPPSLDGIEATDYQDLSLIQAGFGQPVDNWRELLTGINPTIKSGQAKPEEASIGPFAGYAFVWSSVTKSFLYNPKLLTAEDLPKTRPDLANPKYKGKLAMVPAAEDFQFGILFYPKDEWLQTIDGIGKNVATVIYFADAVDRTMLGQVAGSINNTYYYFQAKDKNADAPLAVHWFQDYTPLSNVSSMVFKGAQHPAAASLWAMWMSTPEAEDILQKAVPYPNLAIGHTAIDERERSATQKSGTKIVTYFDNPKYLETLQWYASKDGEAYAAQILRAQTQRK